MKARLVKLFVLVLILSAFPMAAHAETFVFDLSKTQVLTGEKFYLMYAWSGDFKPVSVTFTTTVPAGLTLNGAPCDGSQTCTFSYTLNSQGYGGISMSIQAWANVEGTFNIVTAYQENGGSLSGTITRTVTANGPISFTLTVNPDSVTEKQSFTMETNFTSLVPVGPGYLARFRIPAGVYIDLPIGVENPCRNGKGCVYHMEFDPGAPGTRLAVLDGYTKKAGAYQIVGELLYSGAVQKSTSVTVTVSKK